MFFERIYEIPSVRLTAKQRDGFRQGRCHLNRLSIKRQVQHYKMVTAKNRGIINKQAPISTLLGNRL